MGEPVLGAAQAGNTSASRRAHHGDVLVLGVTIVGLGLAGLAFIAAATRRRRRLPEAVCRELALIPPVRWNQHLVDLELSDGRVVERVWIAYGRYVALIGGRMRSQRYAVDEVIHARHRAVDASE
jgi:hypothetical protein